MWLREHPGAERPYDYWTEFKSHLAEGFKNRCGYSAMLDASGGTVDHFKSWSGHPDLAYEWTNYRFACELLNKAKQTADVLDPYKVGEGWFEILLPSLQLVATDKVPEDLRDRATTTLKKLLLGNDERILRTRRQWYKLYTDGMLTLDGLRKTAPLIAAAVESQRAAAPSQSNQ